MEENKMTFEKALGMIVDAVSDVEGLEDAFDVVRTVGTRETNTGNEDYKTMYEDLKEKYRKRFKEEITSTPEPVARTETETVDKNLTVEDLDFDARTE
jgi:hypothetical protein